ncbi:MAG: hypothetical protein ACW990_04090 [Promethearchaeota archaeon]|jgi:tetratricopeptide (TPR) repeat protein
MSHSEPKELAQAALFIREGKVDEALELLKDFEERGNNSLHDIVSCHLIKCNLFYFQGLYEKVVKLAEQTYKESLRLGKDILSVDILLIMAHALISSYNLKSANKKIKQGGELLSTFLQDLPQESHQREVYVAYLKGNYHEQRLEFDLAVEHFEYSLELQEKFGTKQEAARSLIQIAWVIGMYNGEIVRALDYVKKGIIFAKENNIQFYLAHGFNVMGCLLSLRGEIDHCILIFEKSITIFKGLKNKIRLAAVLNNIGEVYRRKGELDRALECLEHGLTLSIDAGILDKSVMYHDYLIRILVEKGDLEQAQQYLHDLEQLNNQLKGKYNLMYLFDKALILKTSLRTRDRGKAEEMFTQLLENENLDYEFKLNALLNLCELLLMEFKITGDLEALEEVESYIAQLLEIAENSRSYWIWGEAFLLKAKLALISLKLKEARRLLTQGQKIAEKYGLELLARKISNEHDELLKKLDVWENLKKIIK